MNPDTHQLIYIADDDCNLLSVEKTFLEGAGYLTRCFTTGDDLLAQFKKEPCDLIILDVMMPGTDGLSVCKELRTISEVPIIILTAKESEEDYIVGLALGGDDYLFKPFSPSMLVMRVRALLRRVEMTTQASLQTVGSYRACDLRLTEQDHSVYAKNTAVSLSLTEFALLRALMAAFPQAVSRTQLLHDVWGIDAQVETRVCDETIRRVRIKLQQAQSTSSIKAIWGFGYRLEAGDDA
ncbi:response regulator transcription factor [Atopobium fossor]|uniref:response regulator transcription factor n=1 Tax=Atopobium fossor TaxID=39487 RepID=UPI0003FB8232|nr:response regulator transcription factor [Atopobium fossor]